MDTWTDKKKKLLEPIIISSPKSIVVATCYFLGSYVFKCSISCAEMSGICRFQSGCNCSLSRCTIIQIIDKYHNISSQEKALNDWCTNELILKRTFLNNSSLVLYRINASINGVNTSYNIYKVYCISIIYNI